MTAKSIRFAISAAVIACAVPWSAQAEYRCDPPPSRLDRNACKAAAEGPAALRQYVQRMRPFWSMRFDDYVNEATVRSWEAARAREVAAAETEKSAVTSAAKGEPR